VNDRRLVLSSKHLAVSMLMLAVFVYEVDASERSLIPDPGAMGMSCLRRSAVCPGWGQLHAGSKVKGVVFLAATAAFAYGHAKAQNRSSSGRRELNRWTILFWLYNLGDAYVDGYLRGFDDQMSDLDSIGDELLDVTEAEGGVSLGFGLAW
jgi:hypothetical protein